MWWLSTKPSSIGRLFSKAKILLNACFVMILHRFFNSSVHKKKHFWKMPSPNIVNINVKIEELNQPQIFWDVRCGQFWETRDITQNSSMSRSLCADLYCAWCTDVLYTSSSCCYLETSWNTKWNHIVILESSFWALILWWCYRHQLEILLFGHCAYLKNIIYSLRWG